MTRFKVKVKITEVEVTGASYLRKWPISKSISSANMHVIKGLILNYDIPRQILTGPERFSIFVLVQHHMTFKLRVFHLWQTNFASYEELTGSPMRGLF